MLVSSLQCGSRKDGAILTGEPLQVPAILAMVLGRFKVSLAERMGGYQGILERQVNAFTLSLRGGCWLRFDARCKV